MPIINKLISRVDSAPIGTTVNTILKTGTRVSITKLSKPDTIEIVRQRPQNGCIKTILKKSKGIYKLKKVLEEYRFGIVTIEYKKDGSRLVKLRTVDKNGRKNSENNGFYRTILEENIYPKGAIIQSFQKEKQTPYNKRNANLDFLKHLGIIRKKNRYTAPTFDYTLKQDNLYAEADLKNCKKNI